METEDKILGCTECGIEFIFSVGEQEFFRLRNLTNLPKRCANCRLALRFQRSGKDMAQLSETVCAQCSRTVRVPFKPKGYRPVYCNDCMAKVKISSGKPSEAAQAARVEEDLLVPAGRA